MSEPWLSFHLSSTLVAGHWNRFQMSDLRQRDCIHRNGIQEIQSTDHLCTVIFVSFVAEKTIQIVNKFNMMPVFSTTVIAFNNMMSFNNESIEFIISWIHLFLWWSDVSSKLLFQNLNRIQYQINKNDDVFCSENGWIE